MATTHEDILIKLNDNKIICFVKFIRIRFNAERTPIFKDFFFKIILFINIIKFTIIYLFLNLNRNETVLLRCWMLRWCGYFKLPNAAFKFSSIFFCKFAFILFY